MAAPLIPILMGAYRAYKLYKTAKFIKSGYEAVKKATPSMAAAVNKSEDTINFSKPSKVASVKDKVIDAKNFFTVTAKDVLEESKNSNGNIMEAVKSTLNKKGIDTKKITVLAGDVGNLVKDVSKGVKRGMKN